MPHRSNPYTTPTAMTRARSLRREAPVPERILWGLLRGRRLAGWKFRRQQPVGPYIVDFICEEAGLVVELDGMSHVGQGKRDDRRTAYLEQHGLQVIRFTNDDLLEDKMVVAQAIVNKVEHLTVRPSPQPSPKGRGG